MKKVRDIVVKGNHWPLANGQFSVPRSLFSVLRCTAVLLTCCLSSPACAQTTDFGIEWQASYSFKPWRGGSITIGEKMRLADNASRFSQSKTSAAIQHTVPSRWLSLYDIRLRIGAGYTFIDRLTDHSYYELQHRLMAQAALSWDYGFWRFGGRTRIQCTFRDEKRGSYRYNPKLALRWRLSATYSMPDRPWRFGGYAEYFCRLNDPRGTLIDEMRYTLFATYRLDRHQSLSLYAKYFHEMQVSNPIRMPLLGIGYEWN